ncbi:MAG: outer membrane protein assembly factor BamE [Alphaproteobacteria bacterium]
MFKKIVLLSCLCVAGCGLETYQSGDLPATKRLESIKVGDSKEKVLRVLGTPNYTSVKAEGVDDLMIYAQTNKSSRVFFNPKATNQDVYLFLFNEKGVVQEAKHLTLEDAKKVAYESKTTSVEGKNLSILEELAENFGRYNAGGNDSTIRR